MDLDKGKDIPGKIQVKALDQGGKIVAVFLDISRAQLDQLLRETRESRVVLCVQDEAGIPVITIEPPGLRNPYGWRATLRDGEVLVQGDRLPEKGKNRDEWKRVVEPKEIPVDRVAKVEFYPLHESGYWVPLSVELEPGDRFEYTRTIDDKAEVGDGGKERLVFSGCVAVRLTKIKANGSREIKRAYMDGSYEESEIAGYIGGNYALEA